jgi:hypothetical protein
MEILQILAITLLTATLFGLFFRALEFFDQLIKK